MSSYETQQVRGWIGRPALDADGLTAGVIEDVLEDDAGEHPTWFVLRTMEAGGALRYAPVHGAVAAGDRLRLPWTNERIDRSAAGDDANLPSSDDVWSVAAPLATEAEVVRSEEELDVQVRSRAVGAVTVRTWVEEDAVHASVPVRHEVARLLSAPPVEGTAASISAEEIELELFTDELFVDKRWVPIERVRVETTVVEEQVAVTDDVRIERVAVDSDVRRD